MIILFSLILPIICALISAISAALTLRRLFKKKNPDLSSIIGLILTLFFGIIALVLPMQSLAFQHGQIIEQQREMINNQNQMIDNQKLMIDNQNQMLNNQNQMINNQNRMLDNQNRMIDNQKQIIRTLEKR